MEILNKRAKFDYFIESEYEAGIVLTGTEIKSVRNGHCNIRDCYGIVKNNEIFLLNMLNHQHQQDSFTYILEHAYLLPIFYGCIRVRPGLPRQGIASSYTLIQVQP